jgi:hypothetical protein
MRYDDWDVILFPKDSHVPIQEFKTACYVSPEECKHPPPIRLTYLFGDTIRTNTNAIASRWPSTSNSDLLYQLPSTLYTLSHLGTLLGYGSESLGAHRVPTEGQSESGVHCSGHC